jgi:hypothetical protein
MASSRRSPSDLLLHEERMTEEPEPRRGIQPATAAALWTLTGSGTPSRSLTDTNSDDV